MRGPRAADQAGKLDGVGGAHFQMRVAVQLDEFKGSAEEGGGFFRLGRPLRGRAARAGFAARAEDKMGGPAGAGLAGDDAAAGKFDVVGMRAKGEERRGFRRGFRCRLHRSGQWDRVDKSYFRRIGGAKISLFARARNIMRAVDDRLHPAQARVAGGADLFLAEGESGEG